MFKNTYFQEHLRMAASENTGEALAKWLKKNVGRIFSSHRTIID